MKAMLLAAGNGRRMLPLTFERPKAILPILGRPLVLQKLQWLQAEGVDEVVMNLHHMPDHVRQVVRSGDHTGALTVHFSEEPELLGTGGGLAQVAPELRGVDPIVVCNADFLADIDLASLVEVHRASPHLATLVLVPWRAGYSRVVREEDGRISALGTEAAAGGEWLFSGCHLIDPEVLELIPTDGPSCIVNDVYRPLIEIGRLGSYVHPGFWWEFGSPELYFDGCMKLLSAPPELLHAVLPQRDPVRKRSGGVAAVGPGVKIDRSARLAGHVALGYGTFVSEEAVISDSVVMPESWVGPRCTLERSIVGQGVEVPASFRASDEVLTVDPGPGVELPPGVRRQAGMLRRALDRTGG